MAISTPNRIRLQMIHKAHKLLEGVQSEEAWHIIGLFQYAQPKLFLQICNQILASHVELTYDYFDQNWPLKTRIGEQYSALSENISYPRYKWNQSRISTELYTTSDDDHLCQQDPHTKQIENCIPNKMLKLMKFNKTNNKFKNSKLGKQLFKQILPSRLQAPKETRTENFSYTLVTNSSNPSWYNSLLLSTTSNQTSYHHKNNFHNSSLMCKMQFLNGFNTNAKICAVLIDYMVNNPNIHQTEGIFRIPGNTMRIRDLWLNLCQYFTINANQDFIHLSQPDPDLIVSPVLKSNLKLNQFNQMELYKLLDYYTAHDLASLLLRCLTLSTQSIDSHGNSILTNSVVEDDKKCDHHSFVNTPIGIHSSLTTTTTTTTNSNGFIPEEASHLLFLATQLQDTINLATNDETNDWVVTLCNARQILIYRIVIQLLLPKYERYLLVELLNLFHLIAKTKETKMSTESLARCTAFAIFGSPIQLNKQEKSINMLELINIPLKCRIDTLVNLIKMYPQLEQLPKIIYEDIKHRLRQRLGQSPIPRPINMSNNATSSISEIPDRLDKSDVTTDMMKTAKISTASFDNDYVKFDPILVKNNDRSALKSIENDNHFTSSKHTSKTRSQLQRTKSLLDRVDQSRLVVRQPHVLADTFHFWRRRKLPKVELRNHGLDCTGGNRLLIKTKSTSELENRKRKAHVFL